MSTYQIYGHTPPGPTPDQRYVPYLQAHRLAQDGVRLVIRNSDGEANSIDINGVEAERLCIALRGDEGVADRVLEVFAKYQRHLMKGGEASSPGRDSTLIIAAQLTAAHFASVIQNARDTENT